MNRSSLKMGKAGQFVYSISGLFVLFCCTGATPVQTVDLHEFEDNWNFDIQPHQEPLLGQTTKNHILPPPGETDIHHKESPKKRIQERIGKKLGNAVRSRVSCPACTLAVGLLLREVEQNTSVEEIKTKFVSICVSFKIESEQICTGMFDVFGAAVLPVLKVIQVGPDQICRLILGETCGDVATPLYEWEVELPNTPKPDIEERDLVEEGLPTFKVLQLADTHYDPDYSVGSPSNCQEPLCCRPYNTPPEQEKVIPAGKWGSYAKCDSPKILLDNMLKHIAEEHPDIDYIIWTGDLPPHDIWNQTKESNLDIIQATVEQMFEIFPNVPIFPALGNHESIPAGTFAPPWIHEPDQSIAWLYNKVADHWRKWLPASSGHTVLHGGFYSILVRPGFRIISLNTNYCHTINWWLLVNSTDPAKELQWLVRELQYAEDHREKVHIIGHIAPGASDCMRVWSQNFNKIVERFENTIQGQFYGHSHADEFEVFYDIKENSRPISVAYLSPSVTTYENNNPAYRIYYVDGDHDNSTAEVLDHETWTMNLEEANKGNDPKWYRLYSAKNAYNLESLRPASWANLTEELAVDSAEFDKFYKYYYRDSPTRPTCDSQCKLQILCDLKCSRSHQRHLLCHDLELIFGS